MAVIVTVPTAKAVAFSFSIFRMESSEEAKDQIPGDEDPGGVYGE